MKDNDTKDKILNHAASLLQDRGYNGFSYTHISECLGIKNAAVHYHFPTKSDLGTAMIQRFREQFKSWVAHLETKYNQQADKLLDGFIAIPRSYLNKENLICPLGVLEASFNVLPSSMQKETQGLGQDMRDWLTQILELGRQHHMFHFVGPAEDKALLVSAALQGASFIAGTKSNELFETIVRQIKRDLAIHQDTSKRTTKD